MKLRGKGDLQRREGDFITWPGGAGIEDSKLEAAGNAVSWIRRVVLEVLCIVSALKEVPDKVLDYQENVPANGSHHD